MIEARVLQEDFRRHINRKNTDFSKSIPVADGDQYINEAIDFIFENLILKYELNDFMRSVLSQLKVVNHKLDIKRTEDITISKADLPPDLYKVTRRRVEVIKNSCNKKKKFGVFVIQSSDINKTLNDPLYKPSWEWERILSSEEGRSIVLFHDEKFYPESLYIDYIKKPNHIATPTLATNGYYVTASNKVISQDVNFDLDSSYIWRRVTRLAAINALLDIGDIQDYQLQLQQIMALDKIYLT